MSPFLPPEPPDWDVPWERLDADFEWVRAMRGCPQDARHHAEGDVWVHTRLTLESLAGLSAWRLLPPDDREDVFAAALLHDVAKPARTRVEADGSVTTPGHSTRGAMMARRILWELAWPLRRRESVVALVRHHHAPFFLLGRDDPERAAATVSQSARCDRLALVTEADTLGRRCDDRQRLLDEVALFREYCAEQGCLDRPWAFPSDHARFRYLAEGSRDPRYAPWEDFRCEAVLMAGLPGAGKDHWVRENLPGWPVVSLDRLREELDVDPAGAQGDLVARAKEQARGHLRAGRSFVWNATNLTRQRRAQLVRLFAGYGARVRIVYVEAPEARLRRQNRDREARVPDAVMDAFLDRWEVPDATEAHRVDWVEGGRDGA